MSVLRTHRMHALLAVVLLSFFGLTLHTSMHNPQDQQSCELCGGHFHPSHAAAPSGEALVVVAGPAPLEATVVPGLTASRPYAFYRQRAPPELT